MTFLNTSTQYPANPYAATLRSTSTAPAKCDAKSAATEADSVSISAEGLSAYQRSLTVDPALESSACSIADGSLIHEGATTEGERIFSERMDSFESLSLLVGLDTPATSMESFTQALGELIETESAALTELLNGALDRAGLGGVKKKITFSTDASGNIVIEGNLQGRLETKMETIRDEILAKIAENKK